jgi:hypothetical protein
LGDNLGDDVLFHYTDEAGHAGIQASGKIAAGMKGRVHVTQDMYSPAETHNALYIGRPGYESRGDFVIAFRRPEGMPLVSGSMPNELIHEGSISLSPGQALYSGPNPFK